VTDTILIIYSALSDTWNKMKINMTVHQLFVDFQKKSSIQLEVWICSTNCLWNSSTTRGHFAWFQASAM